MTATPSLWGDKALSVVCIPFTAFTPDGETVLVNQVEAQAEYCVAQGNDVALLQGTTGEWPSLSLQERIDLATEWRRCIPVGHKMKLILHIGHDALVDAMSLARLAAELEYDAVLLSPPSKFVAPSLEAQVDCLAEVLKYCPDTPAFYYHYPIVYRDDFDLVELFEMAKESCPTLCGCKLSGTPEEEVIRLGNYLPEEYGVITTGDANIIKSIELPAIRGAICYSQEAPLYVPLLEAHAAGDTERAAELAAYIGKSRAVTGAFNTEVGAVPPVSPTAVYSITAQKAVASYVGEGNLGPCRLPLTTLPDELLEGLLAEYLPLLEPMAATSSGASQVQAKM